MISGVFFCTVRHASCNLACIANTVECTETSHKKQMVVSSNPELNNMTT